MCAMRRTRFACAGGVAVEVGCVVCVAVEVGCIVCVAVELGCEVCVAVEVGWLVCVDFTPDKVCFPILDIAGFGLGSDAAHALAAPRAANPVSFRNCLRSIFRSFMSAL